MLHDPRYNQLCRRLIVCILTFFVFACERGDESQGADVQTYDYLIVGAGVAGLQAGRKIVKEDKNAMVLIVERHSWIGGRLDTDVAHIRKDNVDFSVVQEEGGMRFIKDMDELHTLIYQLGLCQQIVPFSMDVDRYLVRNSSFKYDDASMDKIFELYNLSDVDDLFPVDAVFDNILKHNDTLDAFVPTPENWLAFSTNYQWNDKPVNQWDFSDLILDMGYSTDTIAMMAAVTGWPSIFYDFESAASSIQLLKDFDAHKPKYYHLKDGFGLLVNKLKDEFIALHGELRLNSNVTSIKKTRDGVLYDVKIEGIASPIRARKVILAIARESLGSLYYSSPLLFGHSHAAIFLQNIQSVQSMPLTKMNLYFDSSWWTNHQSTGPSFSDHPITSVYTFTPVLDGSNNMGSNNPASMTIYVNGQHNIDFWQSLQSKGEKSLMRTDIFPKEDQLDSQTASVDVINEALNELRSLYQIVDIPQPLLVTYRHWGEVGNPYYKYIDDAYHQWGYGANSELVHKRMTQPLLGEELYIINEAWSDMQGWVNGSLRSTNMMLQKLNIPTEILKNPCELK